MFRTLYTGPVLDLYDGSTDEIDNEGLLDGKDYYAISIDSAQIDRLINRGTMTYNGNQYGATIANWGGVIERFDNFQGVNGSGGAALVYTGVLPEAYNVILSNDRYGQIAFNADAGFIAGTMTFGISELSGSITQLTYGSVITGLSGTRLAATSGSFERGLGEIYDWELREAATEGTWDLWFLGLPATGPDAEATRFAIERTLIATRDALRANNGRLSATLDADCRNFGANGLCIDVSALSLRDEGPGRDSALRLTAARRMNDLVRLGGVVVEGTARRGGDGVTPLDADTMIGAFAGYGAEDGRGLQALLTAVTQEGRLGILRAEGEGSEPGEGTARIRGTGVKLELGYGLAQGDWTVTPFGGLRAVRTTRAAYEEALTEATEAPVSYAEASVGGTSAFAGLRVAGPVGPSVGMRASVGLEKALNGRDARFGFAAPVEGLDDGSITLDGLAASGLNAGLALDYAVSADSAATLGVTKRGNAGPDGTNTLVYLSLRMSF